MALIWPHVVPSVGTGGGQLFGTQVVYSGCQMLGAMQFACVVIVQLPSGSQHAPVGTGGGHGFVGTHAMPHEPSPTRRALSRLDVGAVPRERVAARAHRRRHRAGGRAADRLRTEPRECARGLGRDRAGTGGRVAAGTGRLGHRAVVRLAGPLGMPHERDRALDLGDVVAQAVARIAARAREAEAPGRSSGCTERPAPSHVKAQAACVVIVQAPVAVSQHAPVAGGAGQVVGLHGTSAPSQREARRRPGS